MYNIWFWVAMQIMIKLKVTDTDKQIEQYVIGPLLTKQVCQ